jgi:subtilisin-like proprotein convertase family protein
LATGWVNLSSQLKRTVAQTGLSVAIPNQNTTGITREFTVSAQNNLRVEHVTVLVNVNHTARGNLKITLTSPSGTVSRLAEVHSDSGDNFSNWTFMTVRNWGENAAGTWRLKITDESGTSNTTGGTLTAATLEVYGSSTTPVNPPPTVTLTSPSGDVVVSPEAIVNLAATAADSTATGTLGSVTSVEFLANGTVIHTDTSAPYVFPWAPDIGTFTVAARATDSEGASSTSSSVTVEVRNQAPTVTAAQVSPSSNAYSDTPLQVSGAVASDPEGSPVTLSYQWQMSLNGTVWTDVGGTSATLPASASNAGKLWRCAVRASDGNSTSEPFFTAEVPVSNRPMPSGALGAAYSHQPGLYVPAVSTTFTRSVIINEFSQGSNGGEWVELLTLQETSLAFYDISDATGNLLTFQDDPVWDNIPAGTVIVIYDGLSKDPLLPDEDTNPLDDGRMVLSSLNTTYFDQTTTWPALGNRGDAIFLNDAEGLTVAEVGYGNNTTATPNIGDVGSGRAAYYIGDTEDGVMDLANWFVTTGSMGRTARTLTKVASLPLAFGGPWGTLPLGFTGSGLGTPYSSDLGGDTGSSSAKFDSTADSLTIQFSATPGALTYNLKGNPATGAATQGTFLVQNSADGVNFVSQRTIVDKNNTDTSYTDTLPSSSRYVRFIYQTKAGGNIQLDRIRIASSSGSVTEGVTPGKGNNSANIAFVANLRSGAFGQGNLYRTGVGHQMPPGLLLDAATGLLSGTTTQAGTYNIVLECYNSLGETATQAFVLTIASGSTPTFSEWLGNYPGIPDPAPGADPDGDGLDNLVEYFMALSPVDGASALAMPVDTATPGKVSMEYRRSKTLQGVSGGMKWKNSLADAIWSADGVTDELVTDHGDYETRRATAPVLPGETRKFLRLEVQQQ